MHNPQIYFILHFVHTWKHWMIFQCIHIIEEAMQQQQVRERERDANETMISFLIWIGWKMNLIFQLVPSLSMKIHLQPAKT